MKDLGGPRISLHRPGAMYPKSGNSVDRLEASDGAILGDDLLHGCGMWEFIGRAVEYPDSQTASERLLIENKLKHSDETSETRLPVAM